MSSCTLPVVNLQFDEQLTLPLFVMGYLEVVDTAKPGLKEVMLKHLCKLMADAATYGREQVHTYHAVWLQQLENSMADWKNAECKVGVPQISSLECGAERQNKVNFTIYIYFFHVVSVLGMMLLIVQLTGIARAAAALHPNSKPPDFHSGQ